MLTGCTSKRRFKVFLKAYGTYLTFKNIYIFAGSVADQDPDPDPDPPGSKTFYMSGAVSAKT